MHKMRIKLNLLIVMLIVTLLCSCQKKHGEDFACLSVTVRLLDEQYNIPIPQGLLVLEMRETFEGDTGEIRLILQKKDSQIIDFQKYEQLLIESKWTIRERSDKFIQAGQRHGEIWFFIEDGENRIVMKIFIFQDR